MGQRRFLGRVAKQCLCDTVGSMTWRFSFALKLVSVLAASIVAAAISLPVGATPPVRLAVHANTYLTYPTTNLITVVTGPGAAVVTVTLYGTFAPMAGSCAAGNAGTPWLIHYAKSPLKSWRVRLGGKGRAVLRTARRSTTGCYAWRVRSTRGAAGAFSGFLLTLPGTTVT
jgi:hypothetical protein